MYRQFQGCLMLAHSCLADTVIPDGGVFAMICQDNLLGLS